MRAMLLEAPGRLVERELPDPVPGPDEVLIEVAACGVCRTDLQIVSGDIPMRRSPVVPGHQIVGRDVETGERVGVAWLHRTDGTCRYCTAGLENLCEQAEFTGWTADGGYAELVVAPRSFTFALPEGVADLDAAPLLCAGIIGYRSLRLSGIQPGGRLGLFGFGSSAHLAIQVAIHRGCQVYAYSRSQASAAGRSNWAPRGPAATTNPPPRRWTPPSPSRRSGRWWSTPCAQLPRAARWPSTPSTSTSMPEFAYDLLWRERSMRSVANFTRADAREFLDLAAEIPVRAHTEVFGLAQANEALERLADGRIGGSAVLAVRP